MDYQVLALKWRPQRFEDVVGQDHVTQVIAGAIEQDRVPHAFLFSGPRGCGKTTVARILAKALNCEKGPTAEPCGQCESCKSIATGQSLAVMEIDAASSGNIDDIRDLRARVGFSTMGGRYRVVILDEAHQIKKDAANALLKILEEPPPGVIFVLATTELHKIIPTIRSRCQSYLFRLLRSEEIAGRLERIAGDEKIQLSEGVAQALGRKAEGSMRDGLTLFDQVLASVEGEVSLEQVIDILGLPRYDHYFGLTEAAIARDGAAALRALDTVLDGGVTPRDFVLGLSRHFRNLLLIKMDESLLQGELAGEEIATCRRFAEGFSEEDLLYLIRLCGERADQSRWASQPRLLAEALVVELSRFESRVTLTEILALLKGGAPAPARGGGSGDGDSKSEHARTPKKARAASPGPSAEAATEDSPPPGARARYSLDRGGLEAGWADFIGAVKSASMIKGSFLEQARPGDIDGQDFTIFLEAHFRSLLDNGGDRTLLQSKFREVFGEDRAVRLLPPREELEARPPERVSRQRADDARREQALQDHSDNELVRDLLKKFDGEIVEDPRSKT